MDSSGGFSRLCNLFFSYFQVGKSFVFLLYYIFMITEKEKLHDNLKAISVTLANLNHSFSKQKETKPRIGFKVLTQQQSYL